METFEVKSLDVVLSDGQQQQLAEALREVMANGYGEVVITVSKGHVAFANVTRTIRLEPAPFVQ